MKMELQELTVSVKQLNEEVKRLQAVNLTLLEVAAALLARQRGKSTEEMIEKFNNVIAEKLKEKL